MSLYIMPGWSFERDPITFRVIDGGTVDFTFSTGQYSHVDFSSVVSTYTLFATYLQTQLDAAALTSNYTVTFDIATGFYTIDRTTAGSWQLQGPSGATIGDTAAGHLLGFTGNKSGSNAYTSDVSAYHYISAAAGTRSKLSDDYEPPGMAVGAFSDGGSHYSVGVTQAIKHNDFTCEFEPHAKIHKRKVTYASASPYTYEHLWEHARSDQPIAVDEGTDETVYYLRPEGASFKPRRHVMDSDALWSVDFQCIMEGRY